MRKLLLVAISVLMLSSPAIAVRPSPEGYVQEPREGEVYYMVSLAWTCLGGRNLARVTMGPFSIQNHAITWAVAAHNTVDARAGVLSSSYKVNSLIYLEDDAEIWLDPNDFGRMLRDYAESCAASVPPE